MGSLVTYVLQVSLILLIFGAIAFGLVRFAKRPTLGGTGPLELVARLHLEGRRVVYLIRAGGRLLVVGGSEAGLTRLGELDDDRALTFGSSDRPESPATPARAEPAPSGEVLER